jgi:hypothetical protein
MNLFTFADYKSTVGLIAHNLTTGLMPDNAAPVQLIPLLSHQEKLLLRGYYNDSVSPSQAATRMLSRVGIECQYL